MVSDQYRMHRLRAGDEWVLATLAKGNARFGDGGDHDCSHRWAVTKRPGS